MTDDGDKSQSKHIYVLSREVLDDIELGRVDADKLVLKCARLARLAGSEEVRQWIDYEMRGYNTTEALSLKYLDVTGRWVDRAKNMALFGSLAVQEASIKSETARLASLQLPSLSYPTANVGINSILEQQRWARDGIYRSSQVRSTVISLLHRFVTTVYHEREFAGLAESTFERYKKDVDALIAEKAGPVLDKLPSVIDRLSSKGDEGISQALSTCRRIIEAFADAIYPPSDATVELGGNTLKLDASKHQNRINAYIAQKTDSDSRRRRLRQNLANMFDRVSTGVHNDVTAEEAFSLFLNVYLFLGEVLHLDKASKS